MKFRLIGNRDAALKYSERRREIDTAIYDARRLREKPFPAKHRSRLVPTINVKEKSSKSMCNLIISLKTLFNIIPFIYICSS